MDLSSLIGSTDWKQFQHHFQHKQTTRGRAEESARFHDLWSEWELEAVVSCAALSASDSIRIVTQGKAIKALAYRDRSGLVVADAVAQLRRGGASVNLMRAEDFSNRILALSRSLEVACRCPVQCNLYVTPGQAQGLGEHSDPHDVLVFQLRGEKSWAIEGFGADPGGRAAETVLTTGDWLFVPKGVRHEVRNRASAPSAHLAIGFHPLTWADVVQSALDAAKTSLPALKEPVADSVNGDASPSLVAPRLLALLPLIDVAEQQRRYQAAFPGLGLQLPETEIPLTGSLDASDQNARFVWHHAAVFTGAPGEAGAITLPYRRSPLVLRPELHDAIRRMMAGSEFNPADLGLPADQATRLCRLLANVGVLRTSP